jgi:Zn-finger nucleic acid-binding protein
MKCPVDGNEMTERVYEADIQIDECPHCSGVWLDEAELFAIEKAREKDYDKAIKSPQETRAPISSFKTEPMIGGPEEPRKLNCPSCGEKLFEREHGYFSGIMIDGCVGCRGIWLDRGELQALEVYFEKNKPTDDTSSFWQRFKNGLSGLFEDS